jgi:Spy/CpxP family protein refolding chaperone
MCSHHAHGAHGAHCGCETESHHHPYGPGEHHHWPGPSFSGGLGVRRPLRFLAWKLELDEPQITQLATVLNALKTERAQAEVDDRRALSLYAEAAEGETFDAVKAGEAARLRTQSAERVQQQVVESLRRIHTLLEPEQRGRLAYLLRTGTLLM